MTERERPILFAAPMVRAIISGAKTQTRRVMMSIGAGSRMPAANPSRTATDGRWWTHPNGWERCPYGVPGDRLWVRETFAEFPLPGDFVYRADHDERFPAELTWRPSIHMPRRASRLTLAVTGVRVERLQEISEHDARAEGIQPLQMDCGSALPRFEGLWESINGKRPRCSWSDNPWVWVIDFSSDRGERTLP